MTAPVAIITGGGTGIGAATARTLRMEGWDVVICGRRMEPLQAVADRTGAVPVCADAASTACPKKPLVALHLGGQQLAEAVRLIRVLFSP